MKLTGTNPKVRGGGIGAPYEPPRDRIRPCLGGHGAWAGHEAILHGYRFFLEVRPIEELQDSFSSTHREEVGRPTLGDYGGFLPAFFCRASFQMFTQQFPLSVEKLQKLPLTSLQTTSRVEESDSPREALRVR